MINRILSTLAALPGRLWRATGGRLLASPAPPAVPTVFVEQPEPRSVAGITFRASLVVAGVVLGAYLLYQLRLLLILVFLAILLAAGLYGAARLFERFVPRILAVVLTYALLLGVVALVLFMIFPPLVRQAVALAEDLPALLGRLESGTIELIDGVAGEGTGEELIGSLTDGAEGAIPGVDFLLGVPLLLASILTNLIVVMFLSALMLLERDKIRDYGMRFVDEQDHEAVSNVARRALHKLGAYVRGQLLVMTVIGVGSGVGMVVIGYLVIGEPLSFAVPLAALSFITAAIPLAGAFIAGLPIVLVALVTTGQPLAGLFMTLWLVVLQQLEGSVITPYIQGRVVNLSAVAVLLGVVAGTSLAGIVGGIIAIPLVAVADVILRDVVFPLRERSARRRSGERLPDAPGP